MYSHARTCINIYEYVWTRGGQNSKHECTGSTATDRDQIYCIKYIILYYYVRFAVFLWYFVQLKKESRAMQNDAPKPSKQANKKTQQKQIKKKNTGTT